MNILVSEHLLETVFSFDGKDAHLLCTEVTIRK